MTYTTTLNAIRVCHPCEEGWQKLLRYLGKTKADDEPLPILTILESNGLDDALWALRALPEEHDAAVRLLACDFAERALRFIPEGEDRPRQAIDTARRYARGEATREELKEAEEAAWAAEARAAARALGEYGSVAWSAAWAAVWEAAEVAEEAAAAQAAASREEVVWATERAEQERMLRAWLGA